MYIDYNYFTNNGGNTNIDSATFTILEQKAEYKLDYFTQNRVKALAVLTTPIKNYMVLVVNAIYDFQNNGNIASFSNDGVSVTYAKENTQEQLDNELYNKALEYLSVDLISGVV